MNDTILDEAQNQEASDLFEDEFGKEASTELDGDEVVKHNRFFDVEENMDDDEIEIVDYKAPLNLNIFTDKLLDTTHLKNYNAFDKYLGLDGEGYKAFKKDLWYLAHSLKQPTLTYKINYKTKVDNRKGILGIAPPASGKTTTKNAMKRLIPKADSIETAGLCHPQQLIGKIKPPTKKIPAKEIPGILSYKFVIHDEVQDMLNEKNDIYSQAQKLKRQAMDTYEDNMISKKLVDNLPENTMECMSPSRILDFAHPVKLESPFFDTGSFRRYDIHQISNEEIINLPSIVDFKLDDEKELDEYPVILDKECKPNKYNTKFNQMTLNIISNCHAALLTYLLKCKNENAFRYGLLMRYNFRSMIAKNIYILALANNERVPSVETALMGCRDSMLFVFESIKAINDLANIGTSGDVWKGLSENDAMALMWLMRKGAVSVETSNVSISKFWTVLSHLYGCKKTQARSHYYRLKKDSYVNSKKGKDTSNIWLTFIPKEFRLDEDGFDIINNLEKIIKTAGMKTPLLTVLKQVFTDDKSFDKIKTAGSVGVWGYVLINNTICVEAHDNKNKNNIYIEKGKGYPPTLAEPAVLTKKPISHTKKPIKTVKTPKTKPAVLKLKSDRETQFFDAAECKNIKPSCSKKQILTWIKKNPKYKHTELYDKFGVGSYKFEAELKKEGLIK